MTFQFLLCCWSERGQRKTKKNRCNFRTAAMSRSHLWFRLILLCDGIYASTLYLLGLSFLWCNPAGRTVWSIISVSRPDFGCSKWLLYLNALYVFEDVSQRGHLKSDWRWYTFGGSVATLGRAWYDVLLKLKRESSSPASALPLSTLHRCISLCLCMVLVSTQASAHVWVRLSAAYLFGHSAGRHPIACTTQFRGNSRSAACSILCITPGWS